MFSAVSRLWATIVSDLLAIGLARARNRPVGLRLIMVSLLRSVRSTDPRVL